MWTRLTRQVYSRKERLQEYNRKERQWTTLKANLLTK